MSPAPSYYHQKTVLRFYKILDAWVASHKLGEVVTAPIDMVLSPHRVVQPDVLYVAQERLGIIADVIQGPADLVAEVMSLGNRQMDRIEKRDLYEQYGVREYWIIDPEAQTVEVLFWESGSYKLHSRGSLEETVKSHILPGLQIPIRSLFQNSQP